MGNLDICAARKQSRCEQSGLPLVMCYVTGMEILLKKDKLRWKKIEVEVSGSRIRD